MDFTEKHPKPETQKEHTFLTTTVEYFLEKYPSTEFKQ